MPYYSGCATIILSFIIIGHRLFAALPFIIGAGVFVGLLKINSYTNLSVYLLPIVNKHYFTIDREKNKQDFILPLIPLSKDPTHMMNNGSGE